MTYALSFMLMAGGLVLLMWTVAATLRFKKQRETVVWSVPPSMAAPSKEYDAVPKSASPRRSEFTSHAASPGNGWYEIEYGAGKGIRYAPDMGGFTEVPLQINDSHNNTMYIRKRIWMN